VHRKYGRQDYLDPALHKPGRDRFIRGRCAEQGQAEAFMCTGAPRSQRGRYAPPDPVARTKRRFLLKSGSLLKTLGGGYSDAQLSHWAANELHLDFTR